MKADLSEDVMKVSLVAIMLISKPSRSTPHE